MLREFYLVSISVFSQITGKATAPISILMFASAVCTVANPSDSDLI